MRRGGGGGHAVARPLTAAGGQREIAQPPPPSRLAPHLTSRNRSARLRLGSGSPGKATVLPPPPSFPAGSGTGWKRGVPAAEWAAVAAGRGPVGKKSGNPGAPPGLPQAAGVRRRVPPYPEGGGRPRGLFI